jgi:hypothetical protein
MPEHGQVIFSGQTRAKAGDRGEVTTFSQWPSIFPALPVLMLRNWTFHVLVVISEVVAFSPATQAQRQ